jgi:molecular chaperone GrpE
MSEDKSSSKPASDPNAARFADIDSMLDTSAGEIEKLKAEVREANDRALRSYAELENYRKRARREMEDERRYAILPLVRDVLNVVDNLQRATEAAEKTDSANNLLAGVKMVAVQLQTYLEQHHCKPIQAIGQPFDPNQHEAIAQEPSNEYPAGTVTRVTQSGYMLHDRVVRPAQVMVSTGPAPA